MSTRRPYGHLGRLVNPAIAIAHDGEWVCQPSGLRSSRADTLRGMDSRQIPRHPLVWLRAGSVAAFIGAFLSLSVAVVQLFFNGPVEVPHELVEELRWFSGGLAVLYLSLLVSLVVSWRSPERTRIFVTATLATSVAAAFAVGIAVEPPAVRNAIINLCMFAVVGGLVGSFISLWASSIITEHERVHDREESRQRVKLEDERYAEWRASLSRAQRRRIQREQQRRAG